MKFLTKFHSFFKEGEKMGKYLLKKLVIIETLMIGIVSLFIVMNYFSNNTIWDLIIHDESEDVLLYENKDATSKAKVQIYEKWSLSLLDDSAYRLMEYAFSI